MIEAHGMTVGTVKILSAGSQRVSELPTTVRTPILHFILIKSLNASLS